MSIASRPGGLLMGVLLVLLAAAEFAVRGPMRAVEQGNDFSGLFAASRVFRHGENPYEQNLVETEFIAAQDDPPDTSRPVHRQFYPPYVMVLLLPFSFLSWQKARFALAVVNCVLPVLALALYLWQHRAADQAVFRSWLCIVFLLALAPLHTGIALGQPVVGAVAFLFLSILLVEKERFLVAGVLLALATVMKLLLALPIIAYFILRGRWRPLTVCAAVVLVISVGVLMWWGNATPDYLSMAAANLQKERLSGPMNPTDAHYYHRVDLAPLTVLPSAYVPAVPVGISAALTLALAVALFRLRRRMAEPEVRVLTLSAFCLLSLMIFYHGYYDVFLLFIPACYAIFTLRFTRKQVVFFLLLLPPFLFPIGTALHVLKDSMSWIRDIVSLPVLGRLLSLNLNIVLLALFVWVLFRMWAPREVRGCRDRETERIVGARSRGIPLSRR